VHLLVLFTKHLSRCTVIQSLKKSYFIFPGILFQIPLKVCSEVSRINHTCNGNFTKTGNERYKYNDNCTSKEICRTSGKKIKKRLPMLLYKYRLKAKMSEYVRQEDSTVLTLRLCQKNVNIKTSALSKTTKTHTAAESVFGSSSKGRPAKNLYLKSERPTLTCRMT
jgi:hypothetical protein